MRIVISTCNKYDHLIPGCLLLLNRYWPGQTVDIVASRALVDLPTNATVTIPGPDDEPWTTRIRTYLAGISDKYFVFIFDDYWLTTPVDSARVAVIEKLVATYKAAKGDLSGNTAYFEHETYQPNPELVTAAQGAQYRTSTQPAIWAHEYLFNLLQPGKDPWQFELTAPATYDSRIIIGPRTPIFNYANVYYKGTPDPYMLTRLSDTDLGDMVTAGMLKGMPTPTEIQRLRTNK